MRGAEQENGGRGIGSWRKDIGHAASQRVWKSDEEEEEEISGVKQEQQRVT